MADEEFDSISPYDTFSLPVSESEFVHFFYEYDMIGRLEWVDGKVGGSSHT